ncbi:MAG: hypothetical protein CL847_02705, partial [Crocinitomicaceae bacterium]|nr:hypothetical protein [Crocinitomicaceae bacterium]
MAQCIDVNIDISGGSWASEISWDITDADGMLVTNGVAGATSVCLDEGCYSFNGYDAYGDGWNGNIATATDPDGNVLMSWDGPLVDVGSAELCVEGGDDPVDPPAECEGSDLAVDISGGSWASEISWDIADADGNLVASGVAGASSVCLNDGCYTVTGYD